MIRIVIIYILDIVKTFLKGRTIMRDKIIRINWSTPFLLEDAIKNNLSKTQGLYYITRVFGQKETSLYLGIARNSNTIKHRLEGHRDWWLPEYRGKIYVRLGNIIYPKLSDISKKSEIIDHAESAILFDPAHKKIFPENISKRKSYTYSELYRIENVGDIFQLKPTIRMHEHEDACTSETAKMWDNPNSLLNRWKNDSNPVKLYGKGNPSGEKIKIREVSDIRKVLGTKQS